MDFFKRRNSLHGMCFGSYFAMGRGWGVEGGVEWGEGYSVLLVLKRLSSILIRTRLSPQCLSTLVISYNKAK